MNEAQRVINHFKGIIDSTLREGFQFSRADFSPADQKKIYSTLSRIGIDYVEVGNPIRREIQEMIQELVRSRRPKDPKILCHLRNRSRDIEEASRCGVAGVNILCTIDRERLAAMGLTREKNETLLSDNLDLARAFGLEIRVGVEDFFRQDPSASLRIFKLAQSKGIDRIAVADTLGKAMPWEVFRRIRSLRRRLSLDIEVHFHNDLGHAVSNSLAALDGGANWVSATLLGIGERTGITPLSSLLANLFVLHPDLARRYHLRYLTRAERLVSRLCGIEIPPNLITNPANGFAHKAGIHLDAIVKFGPHKYEIFSPEVVGNKRNLVLHKLLSGKAASADTHSLKRLFASS